MKSVEDRVDTAWPGVSVVMPVLNEEPHLESAIGRVLDQEYPGKLEVIIAVGLAATERRRSPLRLQQWTRGSALSTIQRRVRQLPSTSALPRHSTRSSSGSMDMVN